MYKKLGILGGMGPLATYTLYRNIIETTPAKSDQEHIDMIILNASYIPDRTAGILNRGKSPLPELLGALKNLETCGCDLIAVPCNTSHYYYDELQESCKAKILNMPDLTAEVLENAGIKKVYLMATEGTIKTEVYQKFFDLRGIDILAPHDEEIAEMMRVIYDIKAGRAPSLDKLEEIARQYGLPVVLGCTEFATVQFKYIKYIDSMQVLQDKILELFGVKTVDFFDNIVI